MPAFEFTLDFAVLEDTEKWLGALALLETLAVKRGMTPERMRECMELGWGVHTCSGAPDEAAHVHMMGVLWVPTVAEATSMAERSGKFIDCANRRLVKIESRSDDGDGVPD